MLYSILVYMNKLCKEGIKLKNTIKTLAIWGIIGLIFVILISSILNNSDRKLAYSELVKKISANEVENIEIDYSKESATVKLKNDDVKKEVNIPSMENLMESLNEPMKNGSVTVKENSESIFMIILGLVTPFGILIIFFIFWFLFMNSGNQGAGSRKNNVFRKEQSKNA